MTDMLKQKLLANSFVNGIRISMEFDESAYGELVGILGEVRDQWAGQKTVDKEMAHLLYHIPQMVRNAFLSFKKPERTDIANRLEDSWVELDALVEECLTA